MFGKLWTVTVFICCCGMLAFGQAHNREDRGVRDLIARWNAAYRSLDAKTLAALQTPDFEIVNRLGQWTPNASTVQNEAMWAWAFANIYKGKPARTTRLSVSAFFQGMWPWYRRGLIGLTSSFWMTARGFRPTGKLTLL